MVSSLDSLPSVAPQITQPMTVQKVVRVPDPLPPNDMAAEVPKTPPTEDVRALDPDKVELSDDPLDMPDSFEFASSISEAEPSSVIAAQVVSETEPSPEQIAEDQRIQEAFQADLNMTALLEIINGADLASVSMRVGDPDTAASAEGTTLPV